MRSLVLLLLAFGALTVAAQSVETEVSPKAPSTQMAAKEIIAKALSSSKVFVFSKSYCPFCAKAKRALDTVGYVCSSLTKLTD
jgi:thioredoxin-related protein